MGFLLLPVLIYQVQIHADRQANGGIIKTHDTRIATYLNLPLQCDILLLLTWTEAHEEKQKGEQLLRSREAVHDVPSVIQALKPLFPPGPRYVGHQI